MRFQKQMKVSARATALALAIGVVGVLVTALPAWATAPAVTSVSPISGARGTAVTITGTSFNTPAVTSVTIGGAAATFNVVNDTSITTSVPCAAPLGAGDIIVNNGTASPNTAADDFLVTASAAPTITSFTPAAGPVGTVVTITGTNFCGATQVLFNATVATAFTVVSATSITATVPAGATSGLIHVTTPVLPAATSATNFGVGTPPTITSFTPTSGPVGTTVTITGTNLTGVTAVKFNLTSAVTIGTSTATSVTAKVPTAATTGKITVTTPVASVVSATDFTVTAAPTVTKHHRSVTLHLKGSLIASGNVHVNDGFNACRSHVTVKIQRLVNGAWKTVGTDQTDAAGKYSKSVNDQAGKYRALAKKKVLNGGDDVCVVDTSPPAHHS